MPSNGGGALSFASIFDIDCDAGLEVYGDVFSEGGDLINQAGVQRLSLSIATFKSCCIDRILVRSI